MPVRNILPRREGLPIARLRNNTDVRIEKSMEYFYRDETQELGQRSEVRTRPNTTSSIAEGEASRQQLRHFLDCLRIADKTSDRRGMTTAEDAIRLRR